MFSAYPDVMTIKDVQGALQIGRNAVYKLVETGEIRAFKIDGKSYRIIKSDLIKYVENQFRNSTV